MAYGSIWTDCLWFAAAWKARYNAPKLASAKLASGDKTKGLAVSDHEGVTQLFAWDVASGGLSRRTDEEVGKTAGSISADGSTIYYHADTEGPGSETGHFMAVLWAGGEAVDLTPDFTPFATSGTAEAKDGSLLALLTAAGGAAEVWVMVPPWAGGGDGSAPRRLSRVDETLRRDSCAMNADGTLLAITTNELSLRSGAVSLDQAMIVWDTISGDVSPLIIHLPIHSGAWLTFSGRLLVITGRGGALRRRGLDLRPALCSLR